MILAYSVAAGETAAGPKGLQVLTRGHLRCYYRERQEAPQASESEVREFFATNQALFAHTDILEFRFPTVVPVITELEEFLKRHESAIVADLDRLRGLVQIAVYLPKSSTSVSEHAQTGTEYLEQKRQQMRSEVSAIEDIRMLAGAELQDSSVQGNRLLLLLPRQVAPKVMAKIKTESGFDVTGPFPPSAFAKLLS
jgi:hypothetical protein